MSKALNIMLLVVLFPLMAQAATSTVAVTRPVSNPMVSAEQMIIKFNAGTHDEESAERKISIKSKHEVLFWMGAALLIGLLLTGGFGIAVGVLGKDLFVAHMICAGLTVTLAIAHAITAFVWFWPY
ncbi:MAG: hypothetical protein Q9M26_01650 [Mariprofundales bacterium]|nr:hypothetical protein [Mariprofundales bacterium]